MELTPKEKAKELVDKYSCNIVIKFQEYAGANYTNIELNNDESKQCALIGVNEMIKERQILNNDFDRERIKELLEIKQELNKL
tara:strand:- start:4433 stop:4681 length:249 start_codon:yes stop_codon:yes gene_type:complete